MSKQIILYFCFNLRSKLIKQYSQSCRTILVQVIYVFIISASHTTNSNTAVATIYIAKWDNIFSKYSRGKYTEQQNEWRPKYWKVNI